MKGDIRMGTRITGINGKGKLELLGERGLTILGTVGCFGTYLVALTVGLRTFLPITAAFSVSLVTLGALDYCFLLLGHKIGAVSGGTEAADRVVFISAGELDQAA
jgi:hypothetical protein